jgi:hypothetical protein
MTMKAITATRSTAAAMPTPRPMRAPVESDVLEDDGSGVDEAVDALSAFAPAPVSVGEVPVLEVLLADVIEAVALSPVLATVLGTASHASVIATVPAEILTATS